LQVAVSLRGLFVCVNWLVFAPSRLLAMWCSVVHTEPMDTPSSSDRVRLTITVTREVHAAFTKLASASGMSLGRAMGEWLSDTLDAVQYTAQKVEEARVAPRLVAREMHAYALGLVDETGAILESVRAKAAASPGKRSAGEAAASPAPRPVIRGVKSPGQGSSKPGNSRG